MKNMIDINSEFWSKKYYGDIHLTDEMISNCEETITIEAT